MWEEAFLGAPCMIILTHVPVNRSAYQSPIKRSYSSVSAQPDRAVQKDFLMDNLRTPK